MGLLSLLKPDVDKLKARRDAQGLFKMAVTDRGENGQKARQALIEMGPEAIAPMGQMMVSLRKSKSDPGHPIQEFVTVVSAMGSAAVTPLMLSCKITDLLSYLYLVTLTLGAIGGPEALEQLKAVSRIMSEEGTKRSVSISLLAERFVADQADMQLRLPLLLSLQRNYLSAGTLFDYYLLYNGKVDYYLDQLEKDIVADVKIHYTGLLGLSGDVRAIPVLARLINSSDPEIRKTAAIALGLIGDPAAVELLSPHLQDAHPEVCQTAALALAVLNAGKKAGGNLTGKSS